MRIRALLFVSACALVARPAHAWWEATLQQADSTLRVGSDGRGAITYELRYRVDRGRFEGLDLRDPGFGLEWDRERSFIEDAQGRRVPVKISRRPRDGAHIVRLARPPGMPRGWVTVSLSRVVDLHECCLTTDERGRSHLEWTALSWDVGMDRMNVTVELDPPGELEADEAAAAEHEVEGGASGLRFRRIRPVRWYEMRVGAYLPEGFLDRPARPGDLPEQPVEVEELQAVSPPADGEADPSWLGRVLVLSTSLLGLLLLALKWRASGRGFRGREGAAEPVLLPRVPAPLRWVLVAACLGVGAWLQTAPFLSAGTLAFVAGVLLAVRGPARSDPAPKPRAWRTAPPEVLGAVALEGPGRGSVLGAALDGTRPAGFAVLLAVSAGAAYGLSELWDEADTAISAALAIDLVLLVGAAFLTGLRRDLPTSTGPGAARALRRLVGPLGRTAAELGSELRVLLGAVEPDGEPVELRLSVTPPPEGTRRVEVSVARLDGALGWTTRLVAELALADGSVLVFSSRTARGLARRVARAARHAANDERSRKPAPPSGAVAGAAGGARP